MMKKVIVMLLLLTASVFSMSLGQLNSASKDELMQINGIGEKKAAAIIKARKKGKFKSYEDLSSRVDGIGAQTAANIKNDVKIGQKPKKVKKAKKSLSKKTSHKKDDVKKKVTKTKTKTKSKTAKKPKTKKSTKK
jgi:competence protein ComEA